MKINLDSHKKLVLITGGTRGLGKHIAEKFAEKGLAVVVTTRNCDYLESKEIKTSEIITQQLNVTDENSVIRLFDWIKSQNKSLDILVNNAGTGVFKPIIDTSLQEWQETIITNLTGTFLCSKTAYQFMKKTGGGRIINIGSIADKIPLPDNAAYGASKSGIKGLSAIMNEEGKLEKIRITHLTLGAVYTDIWRNREGFKKGDMLDPDLVADYISYIGLLPLNVRIDHVEMTPEKGVL